MKMHYIAVGAALLFAGVAHAADAPTPAAPDANMTCGDMIAAEKAAGTYGVSSGDKDADAMDKKITAYCEANPKAKAMEAVQKIMGAQ
jgi:hypothetical protein